MSVSAGPPAQCVVLIHCDPQQWRHPTGDHVAGLQALPAQLGRSALG